MRYCFLIACALMAASLFGQSSSSEAGPTPIPQLKAEQTLSEPGIYFSGYEIISGDNPTQVLGYAQRILSAVRDRWNPQVSELKKSPAWVRGVTVVEFEVRRNGSIRKMTTVESASNASLDGAASKAITLAAPFKELPEAYHGKAVKLRMHFGYAQPAYAAAPFCDGPNLGAHPAAFELYRGQDNTQPKETYAPEPQYSEQASQEKYMSSVEVAGTVDPRGTFTDLCLSQAAGYGLDEKAIDAVKTWKFSPAMLRGEPVAVRIRMEMTFQVY